MTSGWWRVKRGVRPGEGELSAGRDLTATLLPVAGNTITGDALYCQRDYCQQIRDAGGDYLVIVKGNQRELYADIALAFAEPSGEDHCRQAQTRNRHGNRWEIRQLQATDALNDYLEWPEVGQVCRITRHTRGPTETAPTETASEVRYGITSLGSEVDPRALLRYARGHWEIENRLHYVRDVTLAEDASQVRKGSAPQVMAALRNVALNVLRSLGESNIAAALRRIGWTPGEALRILGLTNP